MISNTDLINVLTVAQGLKSFPMNSGIEGDYLGIRTTENYQPAVELMRFMTPFGVGFLVMRLKTLECDTTVQYMFPNGKKK